MSFTAKKDPLVDSHSPPEILADVSFTHDVVNFKSNIPDSVGFL